MKQKSKAIILLLFMVSISAFGQANQASVDSLNIKLYNQSNRYNERGTVYRVIKKVVIEDYFSKIEAIDKSKTKKIESSAQEIIKLKAVNEKQIKEYNTLNEKYEYTIRANDSMNFFGLLIPKAQYNIIMWSIVVLLIVLCLIVVMMFKKSNSTTREAKIELKDIKDEYEGYRKRSLKREQEVAASYQRQINKIKGTL